MKLRDQLLDSLKALPGTRHFHLNVLVSAPHKHAELFPYASSHPRIYAQHMLILCSEQVSCPTPNEPESKDEPQRVFVTAIEAALFHIPTTNSAILYVAKVDSTGQGTRPAPTSALVRAFVVFYANPATRPPKLRGTTLWIHLFARAERQYLFPNSADHPSKKPLNDVKLCAWWKRILGRVVQEVGGGEIKMYYLLPGMNELEAIQALGETLVKNSNSSNWIYGHPYSQTEVPLPYAPTGKAKDEFNLGQLIPSFDDDPKSRFMDEIACTTQVDGLRSPHRKRRRTSDTEAKDKDSDNSRNHKEKEKQPRILGELGVVSADEFWERMSFRQECVAGAITGFFVIVFPPGAGSKSTASTSKEGLAANPLAPQPGEVSRHLVQRVVHSLMTGHEFSTTERSLKATSILEASIRSLCSGLHNVAANVAKEEEAEKEDRSETPPPHFLVPPRTPPRRTVALNGLGLGAGDDISPNPFPEPEPSADNYSSFIYGEIAVSNPDAPPPPAVRSEKNGVNIADGASKGEVRVLTVRKKKR
ncbi:uncharacterized protein FOMMEDRAFT_128560, partial [Fomitiporia mediterranea MF3/22]|uniref:uncharacterized protein n=1 Tax=Fomitiporia mediterranea (strain MF3/22) TaxID=694068 RepID=UPI0004408E8D